MKLHVDLVGGSMIFTSHFCVFKAGNTKVTWVIFDYFLYARFHICNDMEEYYWMQKEFKTD